MVRLRSDRWYSQQGQARIRRSAAAQTAGPKRILTLCVLLVLVWLLIQKAGDPASYERIFTALGIPFEKEGQAVQGQPATPPAINLGTSEATQSSQPPGANPNNSQKGSTITESPEDRSLAQWYELLDQKLVERIPETKLNAIAKAIFQSRLPTKIDNQAPPPEAGKAVEASRSTQQSEALEVFLELVKTTPHEAQAPEVAGTSWLAIWQNDLLMPAPSNSTEQNSTEQNGTEQSSTERRWNHFVYYLDQRLVASCRNGSPWRPAETAAFWRVLQRASRNEFATESPGSGKVLAQSQAAAQTPLVGYQAISEQGAAYRGKWIRFRGWVQRATLEDPGNNALGIKPYWVVWLRPSDKSAYPVATYLASVPEPWVGEQQGLGSAGDTLGEIEIIAMPLKQLAYNSTQGNEICPALVGKAIGWATTPQPYEATARSVTTWQISTTLATALLLAVLFTWGIWYRTSIPSPSGTNSIISRSIALVMLLALGATQAHAQEQATQSNASKIEKMLGERINDELIDEWITFATLKLPDSPPESLLQLQFLLDQIGPERLSTLLASPNSVRRWKVEYLAGSTDEAQVVGLTNKQAIWMQQSTIARLEFSGSLAMQPDSSTAKDNDDKDPEEPNKPAELSLPIYLRRVPNSWLSASQAKQPLRQPFQCLAITVSAKAGEVPVLAITTELKWKISKETKLELLAPTIHEDLQGLSHAGFELQWLDLIASRQSQPLEFADRDSFFGLIGASSKMEDSSWPKMEQTPIALLAEGKKLAGRRVGVQGRLARVTKVMISSATEQAKLGQDHYYELDGFISLQGKRIEVKPPKELLTNPNDRNDRNEVLVYDGEFPMTLVIKELPEFLMATRPANNPSGDSQWELQSWVEVDGYFYRNWSYSSEFVQRNNSKQQQMAPLIAAAKLRPWTSGLQTAPPSPSGFLAWLVAIPILLLLAIVWVFFWPESLKMLMRRKVKPQVGSKISTKKGK